MPEVNFIQKIEDLDEILLHEYEWDEYKLNEDISVFIGRDSKKLYGIKVVYANGKKRDIWFSDLDRMAQILDRMKGD